MFPPETRADVGMVQCLSERHGTSRGGKTVGTRRVDGLSMHRGGQLVHAKPRSLIFADFENTGTIPTSGNILPHLLQLHTYSSYSAVCTVSRSSS